MSETAEYQRLLDQLVRLAPDRATQRRARKLRAQASLPMEKVMAKVPGDSIIAKADYLKVTRQTVYAWMDGTMRPNLKRARQLAKVTGYTVEQIRALAGA